MKRGKGVLILTGHWARGNFPASLTLSMGTLVIFWRGRSKSSSGRTGESISLPIGLQVIDKNDSARAVLRILHGGGAIGILADQNTSLEEGVFVPFFGVPASSTAGLARIALRTDAAVVPGYAFWDESAQKIPAALRARGRTDPHERRISGRSRNTAKFMKVIEDFVRAHPDQWIWVHKRWKTRPPGEKPIYPS